jgi:hypothetical protein
MLISTANCGSPPVNAAPKITVTGIMVFGKVVPTAASTRLWLSPMRSVRYFYCSRKQRSHSQNHGHREQEL